MWSRTILGHIIIKGGMAVVYPQTEFYLMYLLWHISCIIKKTLAVVSSSMPEHGLPSHLREPETWFCEDVNKPL